MQVSANFATMSNESLSQLWEEFSYYNTFANLSAINNIDKRTRQ